MKKKELIDHVESLRDLVNEPNKRRIDVIKAEIASKIADDPEDQKEESADSEHSKSQGETKAHDDGKSQGETKTEDSKVEGEHPDRSKRKGHGRFG